LLEGRVAVIAASLGCRSPGRTSFFRRIMPYGRVYPASTNCGAGPGRSVAYVPGHSPANIIALQVAA
jgi:hypothetical protein